MTSSCVLKLSGSSIALAKTNEAFSPTTAVSIECKASTDRCAVFLRAGYLRDGYAGHYLIWHPGLRDVRAIVGFETFLRDLGLADLFRKTGRWNDFCEPKSVDEFTCK